MVWITFYKNVINQVFNEEIKTENSTLIVHYSLDEKYKLRSFAHQINFCLLCLIYFYELNESYFMVRDCEMIYRMMKITITLEEQNSFSPSCYENNENLASRNCFIWFTFFHTIDSY